MPRAVAFATTVLACLAFVSLPASANHVQVEQGKVIVFDHRTGNEWWVEVVLSGQDAGSVVRVEAMDYRGPWVAMEKKSWGAWAASFHIDPTHPVKFRAFWSGGAVVESCWFTHPQGVESCPVPPTGWTARRMSDLGGSHGGDEIAVGDGDNDGREEVYIPANEAVHVVRWTSSGWTRSTFGQSSVPTSYGPIAVGDANNDGRREVWAATYQHAVMFEWTGSAWVERARVSVGSPASLTVGDVDDDGRRELYAAGYDNQVHMVTMAGYTPTVRAIAPLPEGASGLWIGDGDGNGDRELAVVTEYKGSGAIYLVDHTAGTGTVTRVEYVSGGRAIATGDGDRDGRSEIYTAATLYLADGPHEGILQSKLTASGWVTTPIAEIPGIDDMTFGDADNDGRSEVYTTSAPVVEPSRVHQVAWTGTSWSLRFLTTLANGGAGALALGDADADGLREAYAMAFRDWSTCCNNVDVYWVANHAAPPPPPGTFDATFTGVRGNEWWVQANVAASGGTLARVDVRLDGGEWKPLAKQSWGGWAASYRIVQGTVVQLRATSTVGATDVSDCYRWIPPSGQDAAKVSCTDPPPPTFDATFSQVKGNEWWVEAVVTANTPVHAVMVIVDCDTSRDPYDMSYRADWGKWTLGGVHIPSGSKVTLWAHGDGGSEKSGGYIWPSATPTSGCP
jgi:hypothetical protein